MCLFSVKERNLGNETGTYQESCPHFDRGMTVAVDMLVCTLLQFLITGFNCWQVGKSSVTCNA